MLEAYPRDGHFNHALIDAFYEAPLKRPRTTYGSLNADCLASKDRQCLQLDPELALGCVTA